MRGVFCICRNFVLTEIILGHSSIVRIVFLIYRSDFLLEVVFLSFFFLYASPIFEIEFLFCAAKGYFFSVKRLTFFTVGEKLIG